MIPAYVFQEKSGHKKHRNWSRDEFSVVCHERGTTDNGHLKSSL